MDELITPGQQRYYRSLVSRIAEGVDCPLELLAMPETKRDAMTTIDALREIAGPGPFQWVCLRRMATDYDQPLLLQAKSEAAAQRFIDVFDRKPATEAMLSRLVALETAAFERVSNLTDLRAKRFYELEKLANEKLEEIAVMTELAAGADPGDAGRQTATEYQADEVEPVSENTAVKRNARGRRS